MKRLKRVVLVVLCALLFPNVAYAASGSINVTGSSTALVGNTITITVNLSSSKKIGSWQVDLDYDKSYLKLTSSTAEAGGTYMVNSSNGVKSKSYTFKFKTLKSGNTTVKIDDYYVVAFDDFSSMSMSTSSRLIKIMTKKELEATYSSDATLKSLSVDKGHLSPVFDKKTYEYSVEVENEVDEINISGSKNDSNASVTGTGSHDLEEGNNKFEIVVTAQKGNTQTYTVNVYRKELNPIEIKKDGNTYQIVRKADQLVNTGSFKETTISINDTAVPALINETIDVTLVGVKDGNNVVMYVYKNGLVNVYNEVTSSLTSIIPEDIKESSKFKNYTLIKNYKLGSARYNVYGIKKNAKQVIVYGMDIETGLYNYYLYDSKTDTFVTYKDDLDKMYQKQLDNYKYIIFGLLVVIVILLLICIFKKVRTKNNSVDIKEDTFKEEIIVEEVKEDIEEEKEIEVKQKKKTKKKKDNKKEEVKEKEEDKEEAAEDTVEFKIDKKKLTKEEKKLLKEQKKLLKEQEKRKRDFDF